MQYTYTVTKDQDDAFLMIWGIFGEIHSKTATEHQGGDKEGGERRERTSGIKWVDNTMSKDRRILTERVISASPWVSSNPTATSHMTPLSMRDSAREPNFHLGWNSRILVRFRPASIVWKDCAVAKERFENHHWWTWPPCVFLKPARWVLSSVWRSGKRTSRNSEHLKWRAG